MTRTDITTIDTTANETTIGDSAAPVREGKKEKMSDQNCMGKIYIA